MGYHIFQQQQETAKKTSGECNNASHAMIPDKLEQIIKKFKMHQCAMDFDHSFCRAVFKEEN
jgi:hypothetical protein